MGGVTKLFVTPPSAVTKLFCTVTKLSVTKHFREREERETVTKERRYKRPLRGGIPPSGYVCPLQNKT
jgi:hypothetical protein